VASVQRQLCREAREEKDPGGGNVVCKRSDFLHLLLNSSILVDMGTGDPMRVEGLTPWKHVTAVQS